MIGSEGNGVIWGMTHGGVVGPRHVEACLVGRHEWLADEGATRYNRFREKIRGW